MISTTIFPGRYVQGYDTMKRLGEEMARFGKKGLLICDGFVLERILPSYLPDIQNAVQVETAKFGGECSEEEINRLAQIMKEKECDLVTGVGGGKTLDTAKAVAYQMKSPVVVVPTIASTDAPCSALSVIYTPEGNFDHYLILPQNPNVVLLDTRVIVQAPVRFLVSGMGDALATWFEAESARAKYAQNMTGDHGSMAAFSLAELCYETLLEYGIAAKEACAVHVVTPAVEHVVEANTLLSGIGFESGGLAAAHAIHNGLTALEQTHNYYHGEKVAFGTLTSLFLTDKEISLVDEVFLFCEAVGLPTTFAELGMEGVSDEELMRVAETACAEDETIFNEPIQVTPESVVAAMKATDAYGRMRKGE
jgi:glycerol dehydrogenase